MGGDLTLLMSAYTRNRTEYLLSDIITKDGKLYLPAQPPAVVR